ncbi:unnamed protein product [Caenorhabditis bovis]|uniref:Fatty acid desaturase domain-containing protein n=1 Tax=Caenorhabditis bovis TaxID=2654633 RepID=A0A8S1FA96_9PELO|nr:unnamed protein product [Caenorhabditis bovis]
MTIATKVNSGKKGNELPKIEVPKMPSISEIKNAIPEKCFEKSVVKSIRYLIQDFVLLAGLYLIVPYVEQYLGWIGLIAWYWAMGIVGSALFVVGHDCGHGSFSDYEWLNDLCGHIAHAPILAPFWPWQKSHRQHHQYTSHLEKDKGHPWVTEEDFKNRTWIEQYFSVIPISGWLRWNPIYTIVGLPDGSHFWPWSRLFETTEDRIKCVVSGLACALCGYAAFALCNYSWFNFFKYYYVPLLFQGLILVIITYLQHQNEEIEVYEPEEWAFVRGQTQTIDRYWGFGLDTIMHNITDGHVAHHFFFTKIPHYHLLEATPAIKKILEPLNGTAYAYKRETNYNWFFKYLYYNFKLDYLTHKAKGVLQYRTGVEKSKSQFSILLLVAFFVVASKSESVHWQWRLVTCKAAETPQQKKEASTCRVSLLESEDDTNPRPAPFDPCFEEPNNGKQRNYCNILCPGADTAYLIKRSPQNHRSCFGHFTYKIEKRSPNFFIWRDAKCRSSNVEFLIRCEFLFSRASFRSDDEVFSEAKKISDDLRI